MTRINKKKARNAYNAGQTVTICPHKLWPNGYWCCGFPVSQAERLDCEGKPYDFDGIVREMESYNCNYETGYYAAYYIN